ncbi:MAG TPA: DUF1573 domain-containing protein [Cytophaga sp.]|jgi:hypothetical protein|nr:DUF1573 domain-containing protein [Cytophaga sp.]
MKKSLLIILLGIVFSMSVFAQTPAAKGPVMLFESKSFDFGDVKQGQKVTHTFQYKNTGTDTLKISNVVSSCGCTVPQEYTKIVPPGAGATITVQFDSTDKMGVVNKSLTIFSNALSSGPDPVEYLKIRVNVIP